MILIVKNKKVYSLNHTGHSEGDEETNLEFSKRLHYQTHHLISLTKISHYRKILEFIHLKWKSLTKKYRCLSLYMNANRVHELIQHDIRHDHVAWDWPTNGMVSKKDVRPVQLEEHSFLLHKCMSFNTSFRNLSSVDV